MGSEQEERAAGRPSTSVSEPPYVVVLDRSDALVRNLAKAVDSLPEPAEVQLYTRASEVDAVFEQETVDVLVVGPSELTAAGLKRVARWHATHPATVVVVAGDKDALPDPVLLMRAGAEILLRLPAGPAAVRRALVQALDTAARQRAELGTTVFIPAPREHEPYFVPEAEKQVEPELVPEPEPELPKEPAITITVASATGGCGKTFIATNLAFLLARGTGKKVALVDLDLQFGEVVATLRLKPQASISDASLDADGRVDLTGLLTPHEGGFQVLAAPPDPVAADAVDNRLVHAAIAELRETFDYVIVDTPPTLNEVVLDAFDISDHLLVLATLDVPSIRNMKVFLTTLERLRIPQDGLHLVLNKAEKGVELTPSDIERVLGRTWDLELPYDREVSRAVNLGLPVSEAAPQCAVSKRLIAGVPALVPDTEIQLPASVVEPTGLARLLSVFRRNRTLAIEEKTS